MTDAECARLLALLAKYFKHYEESTSMTVADLSEDLAMSMDSTTDEADKDRQFLESQR